MIVMFGLVMSKDFIFEQIVILTSGNELANSRLASAETADLLLSLDRITLDTKTLTSPYFQSLAPLPAFPVDTQTLVNFGKNNPFVGNFVVVAAKATSSVGAVVYSNQRAVNNNQSVRAVSGARIRR